MHMLHLGDHFVEMRLPIVMNYVVAAYTEKHAICLKDYRIRPILSTHSIAIYVSI